MALDLSDIIGFETLSWSGTTLSDTITVPAGCGAILLVWSLYSGGGTTPSASFTVGGNSATASVTGTALDEIAQFAWLYPGLASGSRAIAGTHSGQNASSPLGVIYLSTDVVSASFVDADALPSGPGQFDSKSVTLTGLSTGQLVLMLDAHDDQATFVPPALPSGWTNVTALSLGSPDTRHARVSAIVTTGASQVCSSQAAVNWSGLAAVALASTILPPHARDFTPDVQQLFHNPR